jgi:hypothetical protein
MKALLWLFIFITVVVLFVVSVKQRRSNYEVIPKIIWSYWDDPNVPEFIQKCRYTWEKFNPEYTINFINNDNLKFFVGEEEAQKIKDWKFNDSPQRMSDLIRLSVISKFGGIWLDASIVCFNSFDWVQSDGSDVIVFSIKEISVEPCIESWFIAAAPNNKMICDWNEEMRSIDQYDTVEAYIDANPDVSQEAIAYNINYLVVYFCCRKSYNKYKDQTTVKIYNASDGPYNYMVKGGINTLCDEHGTFAKFRKDERRIMTREVEECIFNPEVKVNA